MTEQTRKDIDSVIRKIVGIIVLKEYKDYLFHIGQSRIGTLIGLREVKLCY